MTPGWYPDPQGGWRYWDGGCWTGGHRDSPPTPQIIVNVGGAQSPNHLSGMTTGQHIIHGIITCLTGGLWAPVWWLKWRLGRRAIH